MSICVIGGSGFIGTHLSRELQSLKNPFCIFDKVLSNEFHENVIIGDIRNPSQLAAIPDETNTIINLAAEHRDDVSPLSLYTSVNVDGAKEICKLANQKKIDRIIFTSSVAVYGFAPANTNEYGNINPFNEYGRTKFLAEQVYRQWQNEKPDSRSLVIVRPTVVFGEMNRGNVYNLIEQINRNKFIMVGSGKNRKSLAYVTNLVLFIIHTLRSAPGIHLYNYVDKPDFNMSTLTQLICKLLNKSYPKLKIPYFAGSVIGHFCDLLKPILKFNLPISSIRIKKFCSDSVFDSSVKEVGFSAPISLEEGLRRTVEFDFPVNASTKNSH